MEGHRSYFRLGSRPGPGLFAILSLTFFLVIVFGLAPKSTWAAQTKEVVFAAKFSAPYKKRKQEMHLTINRNLHAQLWDEMYLVAECQIAHFGTTASRKPPALEFRCHPKNQRSTVTYASLTWRKFPMLRYGSSSNGKGKGFREARLHVDYDSLKLPHSFPQNQAKL